MRNVLPYRIGGIRYFRAAAAGESVLGYAKSLSHIAFGANRSKGMNIRKPVERTEKQPHV